MPQSNRGSLIERVASSTRPRVETAVANGMTCVVAVEPISTGSLILEIRGELVDCPSRYSVQVGEYLHVEVPEATRSNATPNDHAWIFLNHSCEPNAALVGLELVAIRPIAAWNQITFDYNTTEYEMAASFVCECGVCAGSLIRGFKFLSAQRQLELYPRLAGHLRRKFDASGVR